MHMYTPRPAPAGTPHASPATASGAGTATGPAATGPEATGPGATGPAGGIIADLVKAVVIVRIFFLYPVVIAWAAVLPNVMELAVTILLALESLIVLTRWNRMAGFIQRHPLTLSIDILLAVIVLALADAGSPFFLYLSATAVLIGMIYTATGRSLLTVLVFLSYGAASLARAVISPAHEPAELFAAAVAVAGGFALLGVLVYLGSSLRRLQDRVDTAIELTRRNASEAALGEERSRIAQELHDSTVKSLVGIDLLARSICRTPHRCTENAQLISTAARAAVDDSRRILANLQLTSLPPLAESLTALAAEFRSLYSVRIRLDIDDCAELPLPTRYTARKIAEEALSNAARHSGAEEVLVSLHHDGSATVLSIRDNGIGIPAGRQTARPGHWGLAGMRERAVNLGCRLTIDTRAGQGTCVRLEIPDDTDGLSPGPLVSAGRASPATGGRASPPAAGRASPPAGGRASPPEPGPPG